MARRSAPADDATTTSTSRPAADPGPGPTWEMFEARLAAALERMPVESYLILTTPSSAGGPTYYVQFARHVDEEGGSTGLRAEAVSSSYLPADRPLAPDQEQLLVGLGWEPPGDDPGRNFFRMWPQPALLAEVARLAVRTLREVYGIAAPADLRFVHSFFDRGDVPDPDLGIQAERRTPRSTPRGRVRHDAASLRALVEKALRGWLGLDELVRDADGDYPIRVGSVLMFVRLLEGMPPVVQIFAPILRDIAESPVLTAALNEINGRIRFGRVFWMHRQVIVAMELTALDVSAGQVVFACVELGNLADHLDDGLHGRFGGATMFPARATLVN